MPKCRDLERLRSRQTGTREKERRERERMEFSVVVNHASPVFLRGCLAHHKDCNHDHSLACPVISPLTLSLRPSSPFSLLLFSLCRIVCKFAHVEL